MSMNVSSLRGLSMRTLIRSLALVALLTAGLWLGLVLLTLVDRSACAAAGGHLGGFRLCDVPWLRGGEVRPQRMGSVLVLVSVGLATLVTLGRNAGRS